jgi:bacterioferritin-associated ferredoxin
VSGLVKRAVWSLGYVFAAVFVLTTPALAVCDASSDPSEECLEGFTEAARDVFNTEDDVEKSKTVGEAVGECIECATATMADKLRKFGKQENEN